MLSTLASRAAAMRPLLMARGPVVGARGIYMQVRGDQDPERLLSRLSGISSEDGLMKERQRRRFHEKGTQRRKRKIEEQTIRHANRRIGSMIDFILKRRKSGH